MPEGGVVELAATRRVVLGRDEVAISVADHGAGIAPNDERMLFHPFFTTKPNGHGLGLAISQNIAVEHGGRIAARNRPICRRFGRGLRASSPDAEVRAPTAALVVELEGVVGIGLEAIEEGRVSPHLDPAPRGREAHEA